MSGCSYAACQCCRCTSGQCSDRSNYWCGSHYTCASDRSASISQRRRRSGSRMCKRFTRSIAQTCTEAAPACHMCHLVLHGHHNRCSVVGNQLNILATNKQMAEGSELAVDAQQVLRLETSLALDMWASSYMTNQFTKLDIGKPSCTNTSVSRVLNFFWGVYVCNFGLTFQWMPGLRSYRTCCVNPTCSIHHVSTSEKGERPGLGVRLQRLPIYK